MPDIIDDTPSRDDDFSNDCAEDYDPDWSQDRFTTPDPDEDYGYE